MKLDKIIDDSYIIQMNAERLIQTGLVEEDFKRIYKAKDTSFNRRMVTQLLLDQYEEAEKTYKMRLSLIASETTGDVFKSNAATLIMDYARGICFINPQKALCLMQKALEFFLCREQEHLRRIMLCKIDLIVLQSIVDEKFDRTLLRLLTENLLKRQYYSESFKSLLKYYACKIIESSKFLEKTGRIKNEKIGNILFDEANKEIYTYLLETGMTPTKREKFLYDNLMIYINSQSGNLQEALKCAEDVCEFISPAGESYRLIAEHNLNNIKNIKKISWCTINTLRNPDVFLLDCRFW